MVDESRISEVSPLGVTWFTTYKPRAAHKTPIAHPFRSQLLHPLLLQRLLWNSDGPETPK